MGVDRRGIGARIGVPRHRRREVPHLPAGRADKPLRINEWGDWYEPAGTLTNDYHLLLAFMAATLAIGILVTRRAWDAVVLFPLAAALRVPLSEFKAMVGRPRPTDLEIRDVVVEGSAFPSGHVMTATAIFGLWSVLAPELLPPRLVTPVRVFAGLVVLLHAISRMWGGVHWLSDTG